MRLHHSAEKQNKKMNTTSKDVDEEDEDEEQQQFALQYRMASEKRHNMLGIRLMAMCIKSTQVPTNEAEQ